jgi:hypothetical protein
MPDGDPDVRERPLEGTTVAMASMAKVETVNRGAAYVAECRSAGVPVPDTVIDLDNGWEFIDEPPITTLFMEPTLADSRLWTFEDDDGICLALPRGGAGQAATVVGMICMGWNGMTCYFTNALGETFSPIEAIAIDELVGGTDLVNAPEGVCSDCHAGENPFIIHPEDPAFATVLGIRPNEWPTPIVPATFPGNPDPLAQLGAVADGQLRCDGCHTNGGPGGRLPFVSNAYDGFCDLVLAPAVGQSPPLPTTMPPTGCAPEDEECTRCAPDDEECTNLWGGVADYDDHVTWLTDACDVAPGVGVVVPFNPPTMLVRPPDVDPPYRCTKHVRVSNAVYGASLKLYLGANPVAVATGVFRDPEAGFVFTLPNELAAGTSVSVNQKVGAATSANTTAADLEGFRREVASGLGA